MLPLIAHPAPGTTTLWQAIKNVNTTAVFIAHRIGRLVRLETKIHMVKAKKLCICTFFEGGGWLSVFLSKDMGVAYTSEYGILRVY